VNFIGVHRFVERIWDYLWQTSWLSWAGIDLHIRLLRSWVDLWPVIIKDHLVGSLVSHLDVRHRETLIDHLSDLFLGLLLNTLLDEGLHTMQVSIIIRAWTFNILLKFWSSSVKSLGLDLRWVGLGGGSSWFDKDLQLSLVVALGALVGKNKIVVVSNGDPVLGLVLVPDLVFSLHILNVNFDKGPKGLHVSRGVTDLFHSARHRELQLDFWQLTAIWNLLLHTWEYLSNF
jgi:hypothetical protein